jgi:hypothetical protein
MVRARALAPIASARPRPRTCLLLQILFVSGGLISQRRRRGREVDAIELILQSASEVKAWLPLPSVGLSSLPMAATPRATRRRHKPREATVAISAAQHLFLNDQSRSERRRTSIRNLCRDRQREALLERHRAMGMKSHGRFAWRPMAITQVYPCGPARHLARLANSRQLVQNSSSPYLTCHRCRLCVACCVASVRDYIDTRLSGFRYYIFINICTPSRIHTHIHSTQRHQHSPHSPLPRTHTRPTQDALSVCLTDTHTHASLLLSL